MKVWYTFVWYTYMIYISEWYTFEKSKLSPKKECLLKISYNNLFWTPLKTKLKIYVFELHIKLSFIIIQNYIIHHYFHSELILSNLNTFGKYDCLNKIDADS